MQKRVLILDQERIGRKLQRMAYQIWENNNNQTELTFVGIEGTGMAVAQQLAAHLRKISPLRVDVHHLQMNKKHPLQNDIRLDTELTGKSIVLIDDVANSGRTLLYALKPILAFEPRQIQVAVLVDRKHKSFPVSPDIVGHSVATTLQEHIEVVCEGAEITAAYLQ